MSSLHRSLSHLVEISTRPPNDGRSSTDSEDVATRIDPTLVPESSDWSLMPGSRIRRAWDAVLMVAVLYSITVVPFQFAFLPPYPIPIDNFIADTIFIIDVFLQLVAYHTNAFGDVVTPRWRSFLYYLKGWFTIDLVSSIPYSYIILGRHLTVTHGAIFVPVNILRLVRMVKVLKAVRLSKKYTSAEFNTRIHPSVMRLLQLLLSVFVVGHMSACLWYFIGRVYDDDPHSWINRNAADFNIAGADAFDLYLVCLYFSFTTLATVGYGDITPQTRPELVFAMMLLIIGVVVFSYAMANVTSLMYEIDRDARNFRSRMGALLSFCRKANVRFDLQQQIVKQMSYEWRRAPLSEDWESIRSELPSDVRSLLMWNIYTVTFRASRTFSAIETQFSDVHRKLVGSVRPLRTVRGQMLAKEGDGCKGIYLICKGTVEQLIGGRSIAMYSQGYSFGEIPMFISRNMSWPCSFRCRTASLFLFVSQADLFAAVADSDQCQDFFLLRARSKLIKLQEALGPGHGFAINDDWSSGVTESDLDAIMANIRAELDKVQEVMRMVPPVKKMRRSSSEHALRRKFSL